MVVVCYQNIEKQVSQLAGVYKPSRCLKYLDTQAFSRLSKNVMITNNPNPCITNCVMQGLLKMCRSGNGKLYHPSCLPAGNLVQSSVERVSLDEIPLHFVCEAVEFFGHVKELKCINIRDPQQVCMCIVWQPHEHSSVCRNCSIAEYR